MLLLIKYTLLYGIVLMLVALGGMFSEHSGIINIALEGIMVIGGVAGVLTLTMLPADMSPFLVVPEDMVTSRFRALTAPAVREKVSSPRGLPMATTLSPTFSLPEEPMTTGVRPSASTFSTATSLLSS